MTADLKPIPAAQAYPGSAALIACHGLEKAHCRDLDLARRYALFDMLRIGRGKWRRIARVGEFPVLTSASMDAARGEVLGIYGDRLSGKSTLARILTGVLAPDRGVVSRRGSLVLHSGLGAGFKPILSVRENVRFVLALHRQDPGRMVRMQNDILQFASLADKADLPLFNLTPEEFRRLGLAVIVHVHADILIFDEALALKDGRPYDERCFARLKVLLPDSAAIIFSRRVGLLDRLTHRKLHLADGRLHADWLDTLADTSIAELCSIDDPEEDAEYWSDCGSAEERLGLRTVATAPKAHLDERGRSGGPSTRQLTKLERHTAKERARPLPLTVTKIFIDAEARAYSKEHRPTRSAGDRLPVAVELTAEGSCSLGRMSIGVYARAAQQPLWQQNFHLPQLLCREGDTLVLNAQQKFNVSFSMVIPPLSPQDYGVCLTFPPEHRAAAPEDILKLTIFRIGATPWENGERDFCVLRLRVAMAEDD